MSAPFCRIAACLLLWLPAIVASSMAQSRFVRVVNPFTVEDEAGVAMTSPFSGGLVQARIGLRDIDNDLLPDLLALNPDGQLRTYRNIGSGMFSRLLPSPYDGTPVHQWFRLVDLNDDGAVDVLTGGEHSEVLLRVNQGSSQFPVWSSVVDTLKADTVIFTQLETVPSLVDIDGDGDLDLFSGNIEGSISFYRNNGTPSQPVFSLESTRYMDILVISSAARWKDHDHVPSPQHGASVLDFADLDGDGDLDLLFGDFFTTRLLYFTNTGSSKAPRFSMSQLDTAFRGFGDDVQSFGFNQPTAEDVDHDGDVDVIVSSLYPNSSLEALSPFINVGTATQPQMKRRQGGITGELDFGTFAAPCEVHDRVRRSLLVGNGDGTLTEYEVAVEGGTTRMRRVRTHKALPGRFNASPAAGDIDGDGVAEVIVGSADEGKLKLLQRNGDLLVPVAWIMDTAMVGRYASPVLLDMDTDGDLDLLVGSSGGRFLYFENRGNPGDADFIATSPPPPFDTLDVGAFSAPGAIDLDGDGDLDIAIAGRENPGDRAGHVRFWLNTEGSFSESVEFEILSTSVQAKPMGFVTSEGRFLLVGEAAGGIAAWRDSASTSGLHDWNAVGERQYDVRVDNGWIVIGGNMSNHFASLVLYNITGRAVCRQSLAGRTIHIPSLPGGLYLVEVDGSATGAVYIAR